MALYEKNAIIYVYITIDMFLTARSVLLALLILLAGPYAFSAVILTNSYIVTTVGINTDTDSSPSDPAIAMSDLLSNLGTAEATAQALFITTLNSDPNSFEFSGSNFAEAFVDRDQGSGNVDTDGSALVEYTISFQLAVDEIASASFDLDFSIVEQNSNQEARVEWSLVGPSTSTSAISGDVTGETANGSSGLQTATLDTAGIYTLTVRANVPLQDFGSNRSARSTLDNLTFTINSVPEPSSLMALAVGLSGFIWRRKSPYNGKS